jgi:hypothetical protein
MTTCRRVTLDGRSRFDEAVDSNRKNTVKEVQQRRGNSIGNQK